MALTRLAPKIDHLRFAKQNLTTFLVQDGRRVTRGLTFFVRHHPGHHLDIAVTHGTVHAQWLVPLQIRHLQVPAGVLSKRGATEY